LPAAIETDVECGLGRGQDRDNKCCQIPTIINGCISSPQVNDSSKILKGGKNEISNKTMSDHNVLITVTATGGSLSVRLKDKLSSNFEVIGHDSATMTSVE
jgi:hypothetical protein